MYGRAKAAKVDHVNNSTTPGGCMEFHRRIHPDCPDCIENRATNPDSFNAAPVGAKKGNQMSASKIEDGKRTVVTSSEFDTLLTQAAAEGICEPGTSRYAAALKFASGPEPVVSLNAFLGVFRDAEHKYKAKLEAEATSKPVVLTAEEKRMADKCGISHELLLKNKARLAAKGA